MTRCASGAASKDTADRLRRLIRESLGDRQDRILLSVAGSRISLAGEVDSLADEEAALSAAFQIHQATDIFDEMVVRPRTAIARRALAPAGIVVVRPTTSAGSFNGPGR